MFTSRPACSGRRCWSAVQSACPGCPVYVLLPSPPARTAQCHPSLPLCLITTVFEGARSLYGPRARAAGVCVAAQPACSGCTVFVPMVSPPVRTAQCHPSLPLCLITTVQENQGHCAVRVLGLHGACADGQSACSDCPMPPLLPVVSAATPTQPLYVASAPPFFHPQVCLPALRPADTLQPARLLLGPPLHLVGPRGPWAGAARYGSPVTMAR